MLTTWMASNSKARLVRLAKRWARFCAEVIVRRQVVGLKYLRHWWVNQNQTYRHEIAGGYLWSPKRNANKARNPFYESMREVSPGDIIFSFRDTRIAAL